MNDEHLDRAVRDADPYRPHDLGDAQQTLLAEITSVRRPVARRYAVTAVAAAAAVTAVLAATALISHHPDERVAAPAAPSARAGYSVVALAAAEQNPRLLIGEPGWKATTVYGFAEKSGTITFTKGALSLEMDWYPGEQYQGYYADRLDVSPPAPVTVDGWAGSLFRYSATRFAVMLRPRDGVFVEFGTASNGWTRPEFDRVRALIRRVDVSTWLAALPPEIVTPARVDEAATKVLADVPLPPGFDIGTLGDLGTNDQYQFGAGVTGRVGCAWIAEWIRADRAGDRAAEKKAAAALRGSHRWAVLKRMDSEGGWSSVFWEMADKTAAGKPPTGYQQALGCD
jgi:hypothetical protein